MKLVRSSWFLAGFATIVIALVVGIGVVASFNATRQSTPPDTASELDGELTSPGAYALAAVGGEVPGEIIAQQEWYEGVARAEWYRGVEEETARQARDAALRARASGSGGGGGSCAGDVACFLECTIDHESRTSGVYDAVSPGGTYRGAYQFDQRTWDGAVTRAGYPEWAGRPPNEAPPHVQDAAATQLYAERGNQPWGGRC